MKLMSRQNCCYVYVVLGQCGYVLGLYVICKQWQGKQLLVIYAIKTLLGFIYIFVSFVNKGMCNCFGFCCTKCLILTDGWWKTIFNVTLYVYTISQLNGRCSKLLFWLVVVMWLIIAVEHIKLMCVYIEYSRDLIMQSYVCMYLI